MSDNAKQKLDPLQQALLRRLEERERMPDGIPGFVIWTLFGILALLFASLIVYGIVGVWVEIVKKLGGDA